MPCSELGNLPKGTATTAACLLFIQAPLTITCCWQALDPARRVVFLDTSGTSGLQEQLRGDGICNTGEAAVVGALVRGLLEVGAQPSDIGLTSPYKAQVAALQREAAAALQLSGQGPAGAGDRAVESGGATGAGGTAARTCGGTGSGMAGRAGAHSSALEGSAADGKGAAKLAAGPSIEALTIDKYQGRDKPVIILSFVRSNSQGATGQLLTDWQRINVALTRAKYKLLMVGCSDTLQGVPVLAAALDIVVRQGGRLQLPLDCLQVSVTR